MSKAIGIIRVSQTRGREGESFVSPEDQRDRIKAECERQDLDLVDVVEELDTSGGLPLERREGMRSAVERVEAGEADIVMVAYFDRLVRSVTTQAEIVDRIESAGGKVLAVDVGEISGKTATQRLTSTFLGAVAEYQRRATAERTREAQRRAIARGVAPWKNTTPGYTRNANGVFEPNDQAPAVAEAFRMRAEGVPIADIRRHLLAHGIKRKYSSVQRLFRDRAVLGELHFGDLSNPTAHKPIVSQEIFELAQRAANPPGRKPKRSPLLLARLGVLRCEACDSRLVAGRANRNTTPLYRCRNPDCTARAVVSANVVEPIVIEAVQEALKGLEGRASGGDQGREAAEAAERAQDELDAAIRTLAGFEDEAAARDRLQELREARDQARERVRDLGRKRDVISVTADDWNLLTLDERRALIGAVVARVGIRRGGGGRDRVTLKLIE